MRVNMQKKILVIDDEENIRWVFKKALEKKRFIVHTAASGEEAVAKIERNRYLLVFSDIFMDGMSGLELLERVKPLDNPPKIVVMTAQDTMNNTIEAMRKGAYDYISKPFDFDEIYALVDKALASEKIPAPQLATATEPQGFAIGTIIGKSKSMQAVFKTIGKSATSDLAVLITGESGTGKEMVARAIHQYSKRAAKPFICINCAAIARELLESELFGHEKGAFTGAGEKKSGKFELANEGTVFLDEIGDMEIQLQAKILRVLQNNEFYRVGGKEPIRVNVRIIAATNRNLEELMESNQFREDLFHRLNVIQIHLPPLRERLEDVPLLANHFLSNLSGELTESKIYLSPEVERALQNYSWRGNIRELENVIKRGMVLASRGPILPEHLPAHFFEGKAAADDPAAAWECKLERLLRDYQNDWAEDGELYDRLIQSLEKLLFQIILEKYSGNQAAAAKVLGINRNTLKRKMDAMHLQSKKRGTEGKDSLSGD